jgi:PPOX class probable F420-dependent enzyme
VLAANAPALPPAKPSQAPILPPSAAALVGSIIRLHELLGGARILWLSSARPDGRPHVVPTWFDWDGEQITVFTRPDSQKVRNVRHEPRVMLAIGEPDPAFEVELLEGEAVLGSGAERPSLRFASKYAVSLNEAGRTIDSYVGEYPQAIRIRLTRLLDWGAREFGGRPAVGRP